MKKLLIIFLLSIMTISTFSRDILNICYDGTTEELETAIKNGLDVNQETVCGMSILLNLVSINKKPEMLQTLFKYNVDIKHKNFEGANAIVLAAGFNSNTEIIKILLEQGLDINSTDYRGNSVLSYAVRYNTPEIVDFLIKNGAKINQRSFFLDTPIIQAINKDKAVMIKLLLENGADIQMGYYSDKLKISDFIDKYSFKKYRDIFDKNNELKKKQIYDFRNINFSYSQKEVIKAEEKNGLKNYKKYSTLFLNIIEYSKIEYFDYLWNIKYSFYLKSKPESISTIYMQCNDEKFDTEKYIKAFIEINEKLDKEYGSPVKNEIYWKDTDKKINYSLTDGVKNNFAELYSVYIYNNIEIMVKLSNINNLSIMIKLK